MLKLSTDRLVERNAPSITIVVGDISTQFLDINVKVLLVRVVALRAAELS